MNMAGNNGTSGGGRGGGDWLAWTRAVRWDRLRLGEKATMLVFSVAVVLGMLVTLVVVLEYLDRGGLVTAETARAAQLSLNQYSLAMNNQRTALASYLLTHDPRSLAQYRAAHGEARADEAELVGLAAEDGVDVGPVRTAADGWQAWASTAVGLKPGEGCA